MVYKITHTHTFPHFTVSNTPFISQLQHIVSQHCPNDVGPLHADLVKQTTSLLADKRLSAKDRSTIARVLPAALLTPESLGPILGDAEYGPALAEDLFDADKPIPCDSVAVPKTKLRSWIADMLFAKTLTSASLKSKLSYAYLRCFTEPPVKGTYTDDEMTKLTSTFKSSLKGVLDQYVSNTSTFSTSDLERLLCLPAVDVVKKGPLDCALCLQLFQIIKRSSIINC